MAEPELSHKITPLGKKSKNFFLSTNGKNELRIRSKSLQCGLIGREQIIKNINHITTADDRT